MLKFRLDSRKPNLTEPMTIRFGVGRKRCPAVSSGHPAQRVGTADQPVRCRGAAGPIWRMQRVHSATPNCDLSRFLDHSSGTRIVVKP